MRLLALLWAPFTVNLIAGPRSHGNPASPRTRMSAAAKSALAATTVTLDGVRATRVDLDHSGTTDRDLWERKSCPAWRDCKFGAAWEAPSHFGGGSVPRFRNNVDLRKLMNISVGANPVSDLACQLFDVLGFLHQRKGENVGLGRLVRLAL